MNSFDQPRSPITCARFTWLALGCVVSSVVSTTAFAEEVAMRTIGADKATGMARAVVVNDRPLVHTAQIMPRQDDGALVGDSPHEQVDRVLKNLDAALRSQGGSIASVVKLNVYGARPDVWPTVRRALAAMFTGEHQPAVSFVVTPLPLPGAVVAMDAVGVQAGEGPKQVTLSEPRPGIESKKICQAAVLPPGDVVYISGQAEPGNSLAEATTATMAGLGRTLEHLKLDRASVVHVKCFLTPMAEAAAAEAAIAKFFDGQRVPPIAYVEWIGGPIEIELIAAAAETKSARDAASYITPPWMQASPNYCRVVRLHGPRRFYTAGLYAPKPGDGAAQVRAIFRELGEIAHAAGSDLRHLAKATYYVSDDDASLKLNEIRPEFYSPDRPPAASKAAVKSVGMADRSITLDMIGVVPQ